MLTRDGMSLFWRVVSLNAVVFVAGTLVLAVSPATISFPIALTEGIVLALGLAIMLGANLVALRLAFSPLERLTRMMPSIDLLEPGRRLNAGGPREVATVVRAFDEMLARLEEERRASTRRAVAAQESERRRMAAELHDEVGQGLTAVLLHLKRASEGAPAAIAPELAEAQEVARASLDEVRRIVANLRPGVLDDLGLGRALAAVAVGFTEATAIPVERSIDAELPPLSGELELAVYRIAQESLTNVARHAGARSVELRLARAEGGLELRVADDGAGLRGAAEGGGMRGMRERALLVGAALTFHDRPEGGFEVRLLAPAGDAGRGR